MKKYSLMVLMLMIGLTFSTLQAQKLPTKKRQAIESLMYKMDYTKALENVMTELQAYPEDYDLNLFEAICYSAIAEHNSKAVNAYEQAIEKANTDCQKNEARYYLAKHYCDLGKKDKSVEVTNMILDSDGRLDDCALALVEKLKKSSCILSCDETPFKEEVAKVKKDASKAEEQNKKTINDLNNKISELEKKLKEAEEAKLANSNKKIIADPTKAISEDAYYKLYFNFNSSNLDKKSTDILDRFIAFLNQNPSMNVMCIGHADMIGSNEANQIISRNRAMRAKDYMISKGINANRINVMFKGNDEPDEIDEFTSQTYSMFKVGDVLTNEFINGLQGQKKTQANYLNRRVELKATK